MAGRHPRALRTSCQPDSGRHSPDFHNASLTYGELNRRANQLAHLLCAKVSPRGLVAVCMSDRCGAVVGLMAILKAGRRVCTSSTRPTRETACTHAGGPHPQSFSRNELIQSCPTMTESVSVLMHSQKSPSHTTVMTFNREWAPHSWRMSSTPRIHRKPKALWSSTVPCDFALAMIDL